jgi:cell division protein FtsB
MSSNSTDAPEGASTETVPPSAVTIMRGLVLADSSAKKARLSQVIFEIEYKTEQIESKFEEIQKTHARRNFAREDIDFLDDPSQGIAFYEERGFADADLIAEAYGHLESLKKEEEALSKKIARLTEETDALRIEIEALKEEPSYVGHKQDLENEEQQTQAVKTISKLYVHTLSELRDVLIEMNGLASDYHRDMGYLRGKLEPKIKDFDQALSDMFWDRYDELPNHLHELFSIAVEDITSNQPLTGSQIREMLNNFEALEDRKWSSPRAYKKLLDIRKDYKWEDFELEEELVKDTNKRIRTSLKRLTVLAAKLTPALEEGETKEDFWTSVPEAGQHVPDDQSLSSIQTSLIPAARMLKTIYGNLGPWKEHVANFKPVKAANEALQGLLALPKFQERAPKTLSDKWPKRFTEQP